MHVWTHALNYTLTHSETNIIRRHRAKGKTIEKQDHKVAATFGKNLYLNLMVLAWNMDACMDAHTYTLTHSQTNIIRRHRAKGKTLKNQTHKVAAVFVQEPVSDERFLT